tara:strand:+ start:22238 stop:22978 length:741 start_codon:yes stop_codon:yes gene_type:complete
MSKLNREIASFQNVWFGGYKTGYSSKRNQKGLEKYLENNLKNLTGKKLLEIGCGGGQWTKKISELNIFNKIYCTDVLSAEHNNFWNFVGNGLKEKVEYILVDDFNIDFLDDEEIDFVFSYDVFCHISYSGLSAYLDSLSLKCKSGAKLLIMYADPIKYLKSEPENKYHVIKYLPKNKLIYKFSKKILTKDALNDKDGEPSDPNYEPRWYWIGIKNFTNLCEKKGFRIIEHDINIDKTNPITLFEKI